MASVGELRQAVIDTLPERGSVTFDELKAQLYAAGHIEAPEFLLRFKREGAISMVLDLSDINNPVTRVSRAQAQGEG